MARVTGPLMSLDASGTVGDTVTFSKWKGRNYSRLRVIPANPRAADQEAARNNVRVAGAAQHWVNVSTMTGPGRAVTDEEAIRAVTPSDEAWNGFLTRVLIGSGGANIASAKAAYAALTGAERSAWDTAAAGLSPAIPSVAQTVAGGGAGTPLSAGEVWFIYQYALASILGLSAPGGTPPTYT